MSIGTNDVKLLSVQEITLREKQAKRMLRQKFKTTPALKRWRGFLDIGLARLTEQGDMARTMARHMKRRGIMTMAELADKLSLDPDNTDELTYVCLPEAFRPKASMAWASDHLIWLCDLQFDRGTSTYKPLTSERPA